MARIPARGGPPAAPPDRPGPAMAARRLFELRGPARALRLCGIGFAGTNPGQGAAARAGPAAPPLRGLAGSDSAVLRGGAACHAAADPRPLPEYRDLLRTFLANDLGDAGACGQRLAGRAAHCLAAGDGDSLRREARPAKSRARGDGAVD